MLSKQSASSRCQAATAIHREGAWRLSQCTASLRRCWAAAPCQQWPSAPCSTAVLAQSTSLRVTIAEARETSELRAAAYLRAYSFYTYPPGRSAWAERSHRRMKADAEWQSLTAKVEGREEQYKDMRVRCFIAYTPDDPEQSPLVQQASTELDMSTKLPADPGQGLQEPQLVVGTLDLNQGRALPAEELQGRLPAWDPSTSGSNASFPRGYLSNVCVWQGARKQGIAQRLIAATEDAAREAGITHMYVHVVAENTAAVKLYERAGYGVESQETEGFARAASRPRRLLLVKAL